MKRIVSFDVGLRNLAFCVFEGTSRKDLKIIAWDVIDVMAENSGIEDKPLCSKCKKPACWIQNTTYMCSRHKPKGGSSYTKTELNKKSKEEISQLATSLKIEGSTKKELVDKLYVHYSANVWKRCVKSATQGSVLDLAPAIAACLDKRKNTWSNSTLIVFEQQPDKRMLCVQAMLHMWFVAQGYKCRGVSATHKLTNIITTEDHTTTYKGRKKTGIIHTNELLTSKKWKDYMMKHNKKDDLCDAFLQGLWVLENTK